MYSCSSKVLSLLIFDENRKKKKKEGVEVRFRENGMGFRLNMMNENHDNQTKVMPLL
ncbi:hypothetical protein [Dokdonia sp. Asnod3-C12]|uniref:hypothetical protein n=1 Tax=Dokdonia sp. Asnod3-C12 TaxID=3160575 RepID=UPI003865EC0E